MSEIPLKRLRELRLRADKLLANVDQDLKAFIHTKDHLTFRRKPDSESRKGDVNVTTTCSCVMALALTNNFHRFYFEGKEEGSDSAKAQEILSSLVNAPWMSSGLTSNNAFTTALVLRTYGYLRHHELLTGPSNLKKQWDLELNIRNPTGLARRLKQQRNEATCFLYRSLSDKTHALIAKKSPSDTKEQHNKKLLNHLTSDLRHIIHAGWIYDRQRFPNALKNTIRDLKATTNNYQLAEMNHQLLSDAFPREIKQPQKRSFPQIAGLMATRADNFRINDYPPATPVVYWFVDGVSKAEIKLRPSRWKTLCEFASREFNHQRSLVVAKHYAMMDPVTMGMAACLCARLRSVCSDPENKLAEELATLPSMLELEDSIKEVFAHQTLAGIWPKYFPMFHYQEAGSNFCFTFELLEAVLHEFGDTPSELLSDPAIINGLERAVAWCEERRLEMLDPDGAAYSGWNSGGDLATLRNNIPESWATAVVHMYLSEMSSVLSHHIQKRLLEYYKGQKAEDSDKRLVELLDIELSMQGEKQSLVTLLENELVHANSGRKEAELRRGKLRKPMSALLFGPPGTSKTALTKAIAKALGWPLIIINPSEFVKDSLANVYLRADEIFRDLGDLSAVVVFFDEMDALMQSRAGIGLDTATQFLTTSMLPQLTTLHDKGRVVFLMATNYQSKFDPALKLAGRFDLLLCMGPPTFEQKLKKLSAFFSEPSLATKQGRKAEAVIRMHARKGTWLYSQLELFTFDEFKQFLSRIGKGTNIGNVLASLSRQAFEEKVRDYSEYVTLRLKDALPKSPKTLSKNQLANWDEYPIPDSDTEPKEEKSEMVKYLLDRQVSKKQY
jgi:hypothetical protein